jgi:hypothetical protein
MMAGIGVHVRQAHMVFDAGGIQALGRFQTVDCLFETSCPGQDQPIGVLRHRTPWTILRGLPRDR